MKISSELLDTLTRAAKESPRLRMNYDLRTSPADGSQRMLNALEPGTVIFESKDGPYEPLGPEDVMGV